MQPFKHQVQTIEQLGKQDKQLIILPSGAGKTHTLAFDVNAKRPKTFLYVVHRNEILLQSIKIFKEICREWLKDEDIGIINQNSKDYTKPYIFASIQTLSKNKTIQKLNPAVQYLAIDEYHHVAAESYVRVLDYFKPEFLVGLTATPYRLDDKDIMGFVDRNVAIDIDLFEGINRKILAPFKYVGLYDDIDYSQIRWSGYKYNIGDLDRKLIIHKRDQAVLKQYKELIEPDKRQTIAFCNSVDHVKRATSTFVKNGVRAVGLTYKDSYEFRNEVVSDFKKGFYDVLFTRDIFNEGVDFPECEAILFLRPTISKTVFFQQLGRGLRLREGKENVIVLDFIGNYHRAFDKKKWFLQFAQNAHTGKNIKPLFYFDPSKPEVLFDKRVIEIMDLQNRNDDSYSETEIINNYLHVRIMEGYTGDRLLGLNAYGRSKHSRYNKKIFVRRFGSWRNFLIKAGIIAKTDTTVGLQKKPDNFYSCNNKEALIDNYWNVKTKWAELNIPNRLRVISHCPPRDYFENIKYSRYGIRNYKRVWGSYLKFLQEIRELQGDEIFPNYSREVRINREGHIQTAISRLQKQLGRHFISVIEWEKAYGGYCKTYIDSLGGFAEFRRHYGIPDTAQINCVQCNKILTKVKQPIRTRYCSKECKRMYWMHARRRDALSSNYTEHSKK